MVVQSQSLAPKVIRYGEPLYVQHMSGSYISSSSSHSSSRFTAQMYPLGQVSQPVQIQLLGKADGETDDGVIEDGAVVRIQSTDSQLGDRTFLEVAKDKRDCDYRRDQPNDIKQWWTIRKRHQSDDKTIHYDDDVYFQSVFAKTYWLARSTSEIGEINVFRESNEWWSLQAEPQTEVTVSSECGYLQSQFEPQERAFSASNMAYLAYCAEVVYSPPEKNKVELEKLGFSIQDQEHFLDFVDNTQAIVVGDSDKIIVVFRGTQNLTDWSTNIKLRKVEWQIGRVHRGFKSSLQLAWPTILERIKVLRTNQQPIWFTGHSLGGALATMAAATLSNDDEHDYEIAGVYTFGQPRVGNPKFARFLNKALKQRFFRLVNNNDMVARVPRVNYQHVGQLLYFDSNGNMHDDLVLSWLSPSAIKYRLQGYADSFLDFDPDSVRDHNMATYRLLTMRQLKA